MANEYGTSNLSDEELLRKYEGVSDEELAKIAAMAPDVVEEENEDARLLRKYEGVSDEELARLASYAPKEYQGRERADYGVSDRLKDQWTAETGRDYSDGWNFAAGVVNKVAPLAGNAAQWRINEEDKAGEWFLDNRNWEEFKKQYGTATDESMRGHKEREIGAGEVFLDETAHNLASTVTGIPLIGDLVKWGREKVRNAWNDSAAQHLVDRAQDAGVDSEAIERGITYSQGDPKKMWEYFQQEIMLKKAHEADLKGQSQADMAANPEGAWSKVATGTVNNIGYTANYILGSGAGGIGEIMIPAALSAASRYGDLTKSEFAQTEGGQLIQMAAPDAAGEAAFKAVAGGLAEAAVEKVLGNLVDAGLGKVLGAVGKPVFGRLAKTGVGRSMVDIAGNFRALGELTGVNGIAGELAEEDVQAFIDDVLGLGRRRDEWGGVEKEAVDYLNTVLTTEGQLDTFYGLLGTMALQGGAALARHQYDIANKGRLDDDALRTMGVSDETVKQMTKRDKAFWYGLLTAKRTEDVTSGEGENEIKVGHIGEGGRFEQKKQTKYGFALTAEGIEKLLKDTEAKLGKATAHLYGKVADEIVRADNSGKWGGKADANTVSLFDAPQNEDGSLAWFDAPWEKTGTNAKTLADEKSGITIRLAMPSDAEGEGVYFVEDADGNACIAASEAGALAAADQLSRYGQTVRQQRGRKAQYIMNRHNEIAPGVQAVVYNTMKDLTAEHPELAEQGYFRPDNQSVQFGDGSVAYVLDNIGSAQEANAKIIHEAVVHSGLTKLVGRDNQARFDFLHNIDPQLMQGALDDFARMVSARDGVEVKGEDLLKDPKYEHELEEAFAHTFEGALRSPTRSQLFIGKVRNGLRRLGVELPQNESDVVAMMRDLGLGVKQGQGGARMGAEAPRAMPQRPAQEAAAETPKAAESAEAVNNGARSAGSAETVKDTAETPNAPEGAQTAATEGVKSESAAPKAEKAEEKPKMTPEERVKVMKAGAARLSPAAFAKENPAGAIVEEFRDGILKVPKGYAKYRQAHNAWKRAMKRAGGTFSNGLGMSGIVATEANEPKAENYGVNDVALDFIETYLDGDKGVRFRELFGTTPKIGSNDGFWHEATREVAAMLDDAYGRGGVDEVVNTILKARRDYQKWREEQKELNGEFRRQEDEKRKAEKEKAKAEEKKERDAESATEELHKIDELDFAEMAAWDAAAREAYDRAAGIVRRDGNAKYIKAFTPEALDELEDFDEVEFDHTGEAYWFDGYDRETGTQKLWREVDGAQHFYRISFGENGMLAKIEEYTETPTETKETKDESGQEGNDGADGDRAGDAGGAQAGEREERGGKRGGEVKKREGKKDEAGNGADEKPARPVEGREGKQADGKAAEPKKAEKPRAEAADAGVVKEKLDAPISSRQEAEKLLNDIGYANLGYGGLSKVFTDDNGRKFVKYYASGNITPNIYLGETTPREVMEQFLVYGKEQELKLPKAIVDEHRKSKEEYRKQKAEFEDQEIANIKKWLKSENIPFSDVIDSERGYRIAFTDRRSESGYPMDWVDVSDLDDAKERVDEIRETEREKREAVGETATHATEAKPKAETPVKVLYEMGEEEAEEGNETAERIDPAYAEWLEKYGLKDTDKNRKDWAKKQKTKSERKAQEPKRELKKPARGRIVSQKEIEKELGKKPHPIHQEEEWETWMDALSRFAGKRTADADMGEGHTIYVKSLPKNEEGESVGEEYIVDGKTSDVYSMGNYGDTREFFVRNLAAGIYEDGKDEKIEELVQEFLPQEVNKKGHPKRRTDGHSWDIDEAGPVFENFKDAYDFSRLPEVKKIIEARKKQDGEARFSTPVAEYDEVRKQYEGTEKWLKAPNGKPTKLTERQWVQVRTPAFKEWFGDWENDAENASKVVDENGEPLVVYHGTKADVAGFTEFEEASYRSGEGIYFADYDTATWYAPEDARIVRHYKELDENGEEKPLSNEDEWGRPEAIYAVFLNLKNPKIVDYKGRGALDGFRGREEPSYYMRHLPAKYDGIICKNIKDFAGWQDGTPGGVTKRGEYYDNTVFIVRKPTQIKSATDNTGAFDGANPDIRFSVVTPAGDAAYMDAVKRGDMETAQRMVREAAAKAMPNTKVIDDNGDPLGAYHATDNDFTVFDKRRLGEFTDENAVDDAAKQLARLGFWFNEKDLHKQIWTKKAVDAYLNITNPYEISLDELWRELREQKAESFVSDLKAQGYDGIVLDDSEFGGTSFVAFEPNQIKSAAPVTYDDAGNVIPLSQRFNPAEADIRFSVSGLYTGSAADYDKPSLHYVGTGEGAQVYGWGLYGSTVRGVADGYAKADLSRKDAQSALINGKDAKFASAVEMRVARAFERAYGNAKGTLEDLRNGYYDAKIKSERGHDPNKKAEAAKDAEFWKQAIEDFEANPEKYRLKEGNIYEQTFFTNRAPGDESHLLKWYDAISDANWDRVIAQAEKEGLREKLKGAWWLHFNGDLEHFITDIGNSGDAIYEMLSKLLGSPQSASEFLARAGIDGIKYPVDSYGKTVKDGDKAGWNYVSFRDDNIRVDHKWTDGEMRFSISDREWVSQNADSRLRQGWTFHPKGLTSDELWALAAVVPERHHTSERGGSRADRNDVILEEMYPPDYENWYWPRFVKQFGGNKDALRRIRKALYLIYGGDTNNKKRWFKYDFPTFTNIPKVDKAKERATFKELLEQERELYKARQARNHELGYPAYKDDAEWQRLDAEYNRIRAERLSPSTEQIAANKAIAEQMAAHEATREARYEQYRNERISQGKAELSRVAKEYGVDLKWEDEWARFSSPAHEMLAAHIAARDGGAADNLLDKARWSGHFLGRVDDIIAGLPRELFADGTVDKHGMETTHVVRDGNKVVKFRKPDNSTDHELDKVDMFNAVFPETAYTIRGFAEDDEGRPVTVLEQPYVEFEPFSGVQARAALTDELRERFGGAEMRGLEIHAGGWAIDDLKDANIGIDRATGRPAVIDAIIHRTADLPEKQRWDVDARWSSAIGGADETASVNLSDETAIAKARIDAWRKAHDMRDLNDAATRKDAKVAAEARAQYANVDEVNRLIATLDKSPRALTDTETLTINFRLNDLETKYGDLVEQAGAAVSAGNGAQAKDLQEQAQFILDEIDKCHRVLRSTGRLQALAFRMRRMLTGPGLTLAGLMAERKARIGRDLTPEETAQVMELARALKEANGKIDAEVVAAAVARYESEAKNLFGAMPKPGSVKEVRELAKIDKAYEDALMIAEDHAEIAGGALVGLRNGKKLVSDMMRYHRTHGIEDFDAALAAVHRDLVSRGISCSRSEILQMVSGYGISWRPDQSEVERDLRDWKQQALKLRQLEEIEQQLKAPLATGMQRDKPSDEVRRLEKQKRELMKQLGIEEANGETRLRGVLDSIKTRLRNRIADLQNAIAKHEKLPPKSKSKVEYDAEANDLKAQADALSELYNKVFPATPMSLEERVNLARKGLDETLARLEQELKDAERGIFKNAPKKEELSTPELDRKRQEIKNRLKEIKAWKRRYFPDGTPEEQAAWIARRITALNNSIAAWQDKLAIGDIGPQEKRKPITNEKIAQLEKERKAIYEKILAMRRADERSRQPFGKVRDWLDVINAAPRVLKTMLDLSATLMQGAWEVMAHPRLGVDALVKSVKSFYSAENATTIAAALKQDSAYDDFVQAGGHIYSQDDYDMQGVPEEFRASKTPIRIFGRELSLEKIPGVTASERSFSTFLNQMNLSVYKALCQHPAWGATGPTLEQKKDVAAAVNMMSGYGYSDKGGRGGKLASVLLWAPRLAVSRLGLATGYDVWGTYLRGLKDQKSTAERNRAARVLAANHARAVTGQLAATLLLTLLLGRKDEDWLEEVLDPNSSNFGNVRIGDTNINMTGGVTQWITLMSRLITGKTVRNGVSKDANRIQTAERFVRGKAAPIVGVAWSVMEGKDFTGEDYTVAKAAKDLLLPLSGEDIFEAVRINGPARGMLVAPFIALGAGKSTYQLDEYKRATEKFKARLEAFEDAQFGMKFEGSRKRDWKTRDLAKARELREQYPTLNRRGEISARIKQADRTQRRINDMLNMGKEPDEQMLARLEMQKEAVMRMLAK